MQSLSLKKGEAILGFLLLLVITGLLVKGAQDLHAQSPRTLKIHQRPGHAMR